MNSMTKILELKIKSPKNIYQELALALSPYREEPTGSVLFIVEGTKKNPIIGIRYPGKKVKKREGARVKYCWANLYDFEVVPYRNGKEVGTQKFTFGELFKDFYEYKRSSKKFWVMLEELYENNTITKKPPKLGGIDPRFYLLVLKWIWIQEDFNYRLNWEEVDSPVRYVLENRTGSRTARGAGRAKFFAALTLLKHHGRYFTAEQIRKIIPLY